MHRLSLVLLVLTVWAPAALRADESSLKKDLEKLNKLNDSCVLLTADDDGVYDGAKSAKFLKRMKSECKEAVSLAVSLLKKNPNSKELRDSAQKIEDSAIAAGVETDDNSALTRALKSK